MNQYKFIKYIYISDGTKYSWKIKNTSIKVVYILFNNAHCIIIIITECMQHNKNVKTPLQSSPQIYQSK
jgi:hypothetical protein